MDQVTHLCRKFYKHEYPLYLYGSIRSTLQPFINDTFEATEIVPNLWLGSIASAVNKKALDDIGIKNIVVTAIGVRTLHPDFNYLYLPFKDLDNEFILPQIKEILPKLDTFVSSAPTLVHCMVGASRSASLVICFLMRYHKLSFNQALDLVKSKRPIVDPNPGYIKQMLAYEQELF